MSGGPGSKTLLVASCPSSHETMPLAGSPVRKATMHRYISTKVLLAEGKETPFTDHCRDYENMYRELQTEIQSLKDHVQELHRDLTKHHSLIRTEIMGEVLQKSLQMDVQIASEYSSVEMKRTEFEETWEETYQRVANEQEIYEAQLHDLLQLRQENNYLTTITKQIAPYIRSIARVKERLEPRLQDWKEKADQPESLLKIYEDGAPPAQPQPSSTGKDWTPKAEAQVLGPAAKDSQPKNTEVFKNTAKIRAEIPSDPTGAPSSLTKDGDLQTELLLS